MFPDRSPQIRHRNELTERDWENAVQGLGKDRMRSGSEINRVVVCVLTCHDTKECVAGYLFSRIFLFSAFTVRGPTRENRIAKKRLASIAEVVTFTYSKINI